jgi:hypothetical protein
MLHNQHNSVITFKLEIVLGLGLELEELGVHSYLPFFWSFQIFYRNNIVYKIYRKVAQFRITYDKCESYHL